MMSKYRDILRQWLTCVTFMFLVIFPFGIQSQIERHSLLVNPEEHLRLLFSKYQRNNSICAQGLDTLILNLRSPKKQCFEADEIVNQSITLETLGKILPTLVYDLVDHDCPAIREFDDHDHVDIFPRQDWRVWAASIGAVIVISISGLVVVALVPMMSRKIYNVVTQFLIALSVGSLIGDAFLHLIPHALLFDGSSIHGHSHDSEDGTVISAHDTFVWKSVIVIIGIYVFFLTERLTIIGQNNASMRRLKRSQNLKAFPPETTEVGNGSAINGGPSLIRKSSSAASPSSQTPSNEPFVDLNQRTPGENPCTNRIGIDEITCEMAEGASGTRHLCNRPPSRPLDNAHCSEFLANEEGTSINGVTNNGISPNYEEVTDNSRRKQTTFEGDYINVSEDENGDESNKPQRMEKGVQKGHSHREHGRHTHSCHHREHEHHHVHQHARAARGPLHSSKPHGHHHGHSHDLSSVKAIAWTIVAGDGLHNFCDGIAIGASFAEGLQGGLSTALAVLCHELPHELGDFAVLVHAGMSVKAALFYNTLSSVLCAAGMVLGVLLGSMPAINLWLFLITAGMFVYIALVDMMPELATSRMHGYRTCHMPSVLFFWQNVGMVIGVAIMLVIAKFEEAM